MTHYDTLGVPVDASPATVRGAYKSMARRLHPDNQSRRTPSEQAAAEEAMREVNAAWAVLGTPDTRADYDRSLGLGPDAVEEGRSYVRSFPADTFVPLDDSDEDEDDDWRYEPDEGDPRSAPKRSVLAIPMVTGAAAIVTFFAWMFVGSNGLLVAGVVLLGATVVGFLLLPVLAMAKAARIESESNRLRRSGRDAP